MRRIAFLFLIAGWSSGCTNSSPDISKTLSLDAISFNGKSTTTAYVLSSPTCNAGLSIPGECDRRVLKLQASFDGGITWAAVPGTDDDCSDGRFQLELANACATFGVGDGATVEKEILLRGETGSWIDEDRAVKVSFAPSPVLSLEGPPAPVSEGEPLVFIVKLSAAAKTAVTVSYSFTDVLAVNGQDYTGTAGQLTFAPGETIKTVAVATKADSLYENRAESFSLSLATTDAVEVGAMSATGTILDADPAPVVRLKTATNTVGEDAGTVKIEVISSVASMDPLNIGFTVTGSAAHPADYTLSATSFQIPAHATAAAIEVTVNDDTEIEAPAETVIVTLGIDTNLIATVDGAAKVHTLNIVENDLPTLAITGDSGTEGDDLTFTVTLSETSPNAVTVDWNTVDVSAKAGESYDAASGQLTFASGETSKEIVIRGRDVTDLCAPNRDFAVELSNPVGAAIGVSSATGTYIDPDRPTLSIADDSATEGGVTSAVVSLSGLCPTREVKFSWATQAGTATTDDVPALSGTKTIPANAPSATIELVTTGDALDEDDEVFSIVLSSPVNATIAAGTGTYTIVDDDSPPTVGFAGDVQVIEGQLAQFPVRLSAPSGKTISVQAKAVGGGGGGGSGSGFTDTTTALTFAPGETEKTFTVQTDDNAIDDADRTFTAVLESPANVTLGDAEATATILDNDGAPILSVGVSSTTVSEGSSVTFTITLSPASGQSVTYDYSVAGDPADYSLTVPVGTLEFASGQTSKTITFAAANDTVEEGPEDFTLTLTNPVNAALGTAAATVRILTNDVQAPTSLAMQSPAASAGADERPTVRVSGLVNGDMVELFTDNGCASKVASGVASGSSIDLESAPLTEGLTRFYAKRIRDGVASACSSASVAYRYLTLEVKPTYTGFRSWNDYVRSGSDFDDPDTCEASDPNCLHAGEKRKVELPGFTTCTNLHVSDNLGAFDWNCSVESGRAVFRTEGLRPHVRLADLMTGLNWKDFHVTLYENGKRLFAGEAGKKAWDNPISAIGAGTIGSASGGRVFVSNGNLQIGGININTDRVAIVVRPEHVLSYDLGSNNCTASAEPGSGGRCLIAAGSQRFLWIEGNFEGGNGSNLDIDYNIFLYNTKFAVVRHAQIYFSRYGGLWLEGSSTNLSAHNTISDVRLVSHAHQGTGGGLVLQQSMNNRIFNVGVSRSNGGNTSYGAVEIQSYSQFNTLSGVLVAGTDGPAVAFRSTGSRNTLARVTAVNGDGPGLELSTSSIYNTIAQAAIWNNDGAGIRLSQAGGTSFSQIYSRSNGGYGLMSDGRAGYASSGLTFSGAQWIDSVSGASVTGLDTSSGMIGGVNTTFVGRVTSEDRVNAADLNGDIKPGFELTNLLYAMSFANPFRFWGKDTVSPAGARGRCAYVDCRIWDFRLAAGDSVLRNRNGTFVPGDTCPAGIADTIAYQRLQNGSTSKFLVNAREFTNDGIGDDDGLCESGETCAFVPHRGAFQELTDPVRKACTFSGSQVTGVTLYGAYPQGLSEELSASNLVIPGDQMSVTLPSTVSTAVSARTGDGKSSGKWYFEATLEAGTASAGTRVGLGTASASLVNPVGASTDGYGFDAGGTIEHGTGNLAGGGFVVGDTIGVAVDFGNEKIWYSVNGVWLRGNPADGTSDSSFASISKTSALHPMVSLKNGGTRFRMNFGQTQFRAPVPSGYNPGWY